MINKKKKYKLGDFNYRLPKKFIAQDPGSRRDGSKLMVIHRDTGKIEHRSFPDITDYMRKNDLLILNNTKVFPARIFGNKEKTGAKIEVFLLRELSKENRLWDVLVDPARKIRIGNKLYFGNDELVAEVIDNTTSRGRTLRFLGDGDYEDFKTTLYNLGETPLPKFINRKTEELDKERYQTLLAKHEGAVAAPTAGMHFSRELLKRLEIKGIDFAEITLHVGLGNFRNVEVEDLTKHKVDSEQIFVSEQAANIVNNAKNNKHNVCAVGTTVLRTLESCVTTQKLLNPFEGWTNKFIFPPYEVKVPNRMISNFHLSKSTLLMMVAAFTGYDLILKPTMWQ